MGSGSIQEYYPFEVQGRSTWLTPKGPPNGGCIRKQIMKPLLSWIKTIVGVASVTAAMLACAPRTLLDPRVLDARNQIHERLSAVIVRDGFSHDLRGHRDGTRDYDSIYIHLSLDSLKRRHYSLDNLLKDIGAICTLPSYARFAIRIEITAGDEDDRNYLRAMLAPAVAGKGNIEVVTGTDSYNDIIITIGNPGQGES